MSDLKIKSHVYVWSAAVFLSISAVFTHQFLKNIDPIVFAFSCFSIVIIVSAIIRILVYKEISSFFTDVRKNIKHSSILNLTTAIDWVLYLVALKYIDASYSNALVYGLTPISALLLSRKFNIPSFVISLLIFVFLFLMGCNYLVLESLPMNNFIIGTILAVIAGIAVGGTTVSLKALSHNNVRIIDVILLRYVFTVLISFAVILIKQIPLNIDFNSLNKITLISFIFVLFPSYLVQKGFKHLSAFTVAVISSSIPVMTYLISVMMGSKFDMTQIIYVVCLSILLVIYTTKKYPVFFRKANDPLA